MGLKIGILLNLGGDVRTLFKNHLSKAALLAAFKPRFSQLSELMPCLIRVYDIIPPHTQLRQLRSELMPCLIRVYDKTWGWPQPPGWLRIDALLDKGLRPRHNIALYTTSKLRIDALLDKGLRLYTDKLRMCGTRPQN